MEPRSPTRVGVVLILQAIGSSVFSSACLRVSLVHALHERIEVGEIGQWAIAGARIEPTQELDLDLGCAFDLAHQLLTSRHVDFVEIEPGGACLEQRSVALRPELRRIQARAALGLGAAWQIGSTAIVVDAVRVVLADRLLGTASSQLPSRHVRWIGESVHIGRLARRTRAGRASASDPLLPARCSNRPRAAAATRTAEPLSATAGGGTWGSPELRCSPSTEIRAKAGFEAGPIRRTCL